MILQLVGHAVHNLCLETMSHCRQRFLLGRVYTYSRWGITVYLPQVYWESTMVQNFFTFVILWQNYWMLVFFYLNIAAFQC